MTERLWYIKSCELFRRLSTAQLAALEARSRTRAFARGSTIYLPQDLADGVLLLAEGRAKIGSYSAEGKQTILAFIDPGEVFGELALMGGEQREEFAEAIEKSLIVAIPRDLMVQLVEENPALSLGVAKLFGMRRLRIERRLKYLLFRSNRDRLIHLVLELAERYGRQTDAGVELKIKLSHQDLASVIGSTRETVTVLLGELQNEGLIQLGRRRLTILDLEKLAGCVESTAPQLSPF
ncbi:MAG: Crp/Fnr family transcriptional regulator [Pirellulales bacterium]|nr:Crp/Fnr family transcriptional regulator [Pirellulales bacterium]MBX3432953.1 Crp/Fnr family transcriptional regulator [Pirellulales bacterium]